MILFADQNKMFEYSAFVYARDFNMFRIMVVQFANQSKGIYLPS